MKDTHTVLTELIKEMDILKVVQRFDREDSAYDDGITRCISLVEEKLKANKK